MILAGYIRREILMTCLVVTGVLAVILLGGRLMLYLGYAAEGRLIASLVFKMVLFRSPEFLQMILPLGFFIGILLTLGRMSVERELAVIEGAGMSLLWIGRRLIWVCLGLMAIVSSLCLYLGPLGVDKTDQVFQKQAERADFETLAPGRFHPIKSGEGVIYVNQLDSSGHQMENLFVAEFQGKENASVVVAGSGKRQMFSDDGDEFLQLRQGKRFDFTADTAEARVIEFEGYRAKIADRELEVQNTRTKGASTLDLLDDKSSKATAELHWRLGLPLLIPNVALLALALCKVNPRQGRFLRLFPAIMIYLVYLGLAMVLKSQIEKKGVHLVGALWGLHATVAAIGFFAVLRSDGRLRFKQKKQLESSNS
ncbi:MAG TPA: LPS export ABC transporter permease LptF [Gammaproteobacteria bacterium]|nr:LPS export ABC transporter permease LptF [Gammaproteobacteria bacterium]MEC8009138.1 LPS export ABC transporter permease LptF [Pseudomonadota bacterium]HBF07970.1 LPS export ABC transporter permease LptF [Gammaproteobacteria bacterium]HCK93734.1 LPS export ABC transporter permease LptF [Gammaproteobacteria bacterium]|tara:strand:- start:1286 stop:2389 length:1104 start_codon:yes stop_codon:yes gene_type:complete